MSVKSAAYTPHRVDLRGAIQRKWGSVRSAAQAIEVSEPMLYSALNRRYSPATEARLAEAMEVDPRRIWPDRWKTPTPKRELWLLKNAEKLKAWAGRELNDVGREA